MDKKTYIIIIIGVVTILGAVIINKVLKTILLTITLIHHLLI